MSIAITGLTAGTVKTTDVYPAVDVTDPTQAPSGTTKKYTVSQLNAFIQAAILAGTGVSITSGVGTITINASAGGLNVADITATSATMTVNTRHFANNAGLVTLTLPAVSAKGDVITVVGQGAGGWLIAQGAGQSVVIGGVSSTVGVGGSIASTNQFDSLVLTCSVANTTWTAEGGPQGNLTIV